MATKSMKEFARQFAKELAERTRSVRAVAQDIVSLRASDGSRITEAQIWQLVALIREELPSILNEQLMHYAHGSGFDVGDELEANIKSILAGK